MTIKSIWTFTMLILGMASCQRMPSQNELVETHLDIALYNKQGINLLDPSQKGHLPVDSIRILFHHNKTRSTYYNPQLDSPYGCQLFKKNKDHLLRVFLPIELKPQNNTFFLQWKAGKTDTIQYSLTEQGQKQTIRFKQIRLNGKVKCRPEENNAPCFIKHIIE